MSTPQEAQLREAFVPRWPGDLPVVQVKCASLRLLQHREDVP